MCHGYKTICIILECYDKTKEPTTYFVSALFMRMDIKMLNKSKRLVRGFPDSSLSMIFQCRYVYQYQIYKEGYFIHWDEEQCLIFANKAGREVQAAEVQGIIEILFIKGILDRNSYLANGILTSANIQKIWMEATKRRKRDLKALPYLLVNDLTQQETEAPEGENVTISPGNVVHDVAVNAKNACNSGQSKVKEKKAEENKEFPPSAPPKGKEKEWEEVSAPLPIPGYAFNTMTHNYPGLTDTLKRLGITEAGEVNAILRLSDYGRKGTRVWQLIANTCWSDIGAKGRYLIAALNKAKRK